MREKSIAFSDQTHLRTFAFAMSAKDLLSAMEVLAVDATENGFVSSFLEAILNESILASLAYAWSVRELLPTALPSIRPVSCPLSLPIVRSAGSVPSAAAGGGTSATGGADSGAPPGGGAGEKAKLGAGEPNPSVDGVCWACGVTEGGTVSAIWVFTGGGALHGAGAA